MSIWRWADWLEPTPTEARITLGEGNTPLVKSQRIGPSIGLPQLWFKLESSNPTGSYKDRFAAAAISDMRAQGKSLVIATSSGNTGASLAAYAAAAGMRCRIAIVETAPEDKLRQMLAYGAELFRIRGFGLDPQITARVFERLMEQAASPAAQLQISAFRYSPIGMSGVQTITWELSEQLDEPPDQIFVCAGGGGLALAVACGAAELVEHRRWPRCPAVELVQPEGNATIAGPLLRGENRAQAVVCSSKLSGLQVPTVIDGDETLEACRATGGSGHLITDEQAYAAQRRLAREEGLFCEPAAAVPLAGLLASRAAGRVADDARVVCLITGSGFKDAASAARLVADEPCPLIDVECLP
ncbi:MAG: pyridoxal-phosphate dependent enzyme [Pirellulales bacterium]